MNPRIEQLKETIELNYHCRAEHIGSARDGELDEKCSPLKANIRLILVRPMRAPLSLAQILIIGAATIIGSTGCKRGLPPSATSMVLRCLRAKKVVESRETRQ